MTQSLMLEVVPRLVIAVVGWPLLGFVLGLSFLVRQFLALVSSLVAPGRYRLMCPNDAFMSLDERPHLHHTLMGGFFIDQAFERKDLEHLRSQAMPFLLQDENKKMLSAPVVRWGYHWWDDLSSSFVVADHIKLCPGADDWNKVYSKEHVNSLLTTMAAPPFLKGKPKWEVLLIPKINYFPNQGPQRGLTGGLLVRMCHSYMDGVSIASFVQRMVAFNESLENLDELRTAKLGPQRSLRQKFKNRWDTFLNCPWLWLKPVLSPHPDLGFFGGERFTTEHFYTRTKFKITVGSMSPIRRAFGCSTETVFVSALLGALVHVGKLKGRPIPSELSIPSLRAVLPYPSAEPMNHFGMAHHVLPTVASASPAQRLEGVIEAIGKEMENEYKFNFYLQRIMGQLPAAVLRPLLRQIDECTMITLIPGLDNVHYDHRPVRFMAHISPPGVFRLMVGMINVNGSFSIAFFAKKSALFESASDLNKLVTGFEIEVQRLSAAATEMLNDAKKARVADLDEVERGMLLQKE